ncbi:MAG TPA: hypothetical protein VKU00_03360 [Chthonomonadaceae bacterium]|nr:hypothetical protein [Chthonomonadaceae bacterium]
MVINPKDAKQFISCYTKLLAEVHLLSNGERRVELLPMLAAARDAVVANPSLIEAAALSLEYAGDALPEELLHAVQSLMLKRWVYLRDTTKYSVFMDLDGQEAYAVLGLTQPIRELVGGTAVVLKIGVLHYKDAFICDGIVSEVIRLGTNYRREYADLFAKLKKSGHFHTR